MSTQSRVDPTQAAMPPVLSGNPHFAGTLPHREQPAAAQFPEPEVGCFCALFHAKNRWQDRWKTVAPPLLSGCACKSRENAFSLETDLAASWILN